MGSTELIAISTAIVGILGTLITAIVNYVQTRSNTKSELARIKLEEKRSNIDTESVSTNAATQLLNVGLQQSTFLQGIYSDCMSKKESLENENSALKLELINFKIFVLNSLSKRNDMMDDFKDHLEKNHKDIGSASCEVCSKFIENLDSILCTLEEEIKK